jgi:hypothetical protein
MRKLYVRGKRERIKKGIKYIYIYLIIYLSTIYLSIYYLSIYLMK